jgi:hypothetical protein
VQRMARRGAAALVDWGGGARVWGWRGRDPGAGLTGLVAGCILQGWQAATLGAARSKAPGDGAGCVVARSGGLDGAACVVVWRIGSGGDKDLRGIG